MQLISSDQTVRNDTIEDSKDFNQKSLSTQVKKGEQLVSCRQLKKHSIC